MKKRILSLSVLLAFLSFFVFGEITPAIFCENSSLTVEYAVEDRLAEKDVKIASDDSSTLRSDMFAFNMSQKAKISTFKHKLYSFELKDSLFKPPIFS